MGSQSHAQTGRDRGSSRAQTRARGPRSHGGKKRGPTANAEAQRFEQVSKAVNGIANGKTFIQPKCLSD